MATGQLARAARRDRGRLAHAKRTALALCTLRVTGERASRATLRRRSRRHSTVEGGRAVNDEHGLDEQEAEE